MFGVVGPNNGDWTRGEAARSAIERYLHMALKNAGCESEFLF
jgi:hypothetical protein